MATKGNREKNWRVHKIQEAETYSQGNKRVIKNKKCRPAVGWVNPPMLAVVGWVGFAGDGMAMRQSAEQNISRLVRWIIYLGLYG